MTDGTTWNDRALARSLGTDDPDHLAFAARYLSDPTAEFVADIKLTADPNEDLEYVWASTEEVVNRILGRYDH